MKFVYLVMDDMKLLGIRRTNKMENTEEQKETVILNGREVSKEELEKQKEAAAAQKGAKLEEVSKGNYRMRLQD